MKKITPQILLPILLLVLPFERIPSVELAGVTVRASMIIGLALLVSVAVAVGRKRLIGLLKSSPERYLLLFFGVSLLSALAAQSLSRGFMVVGFLGFVMALALAVSIAFNPKDLVKYRRALFWGAGITLAFALYQFLADLAGLPGWATGLRDIYTKRVFGFPRIQAASLEPLYYANYLLLPLSLALGLSLGDKIRKTFVVALFAAIFLTVSRGGIAAAVMATLAFGGYAAYEKKAKLAAQALTAMIAGLIIAYTFIAILVPLSGKFNIFTKSGTTAEQLQKRKEAASTFQRQAVNYELDGANKSERAITRELAVEQFKDRPFLGVGPGNFGILAHSMNPIIPESGIVNNLPLEILAETGLLGMLSLLVFGASLLHWGVKSHNLVKDPKIKTWIAAILIFLAAIAVQYQAFSTLYIIHVWVAIGLLMGLIRAAAAQQPNRQK